MLNTPLHNGRRLYFTDPGQFVQLLRGGGIDVDLASPDDMAFSCNGLGGRQNCQRRIAILGGGKVSHHSSGRPQRRSRSHDPASFP